MTNQPPSPFDPNDGETANGKASTLLLPRDVEGDMLDGSPGNIISGRDYIHRLDGSFKGLASDVDQALAKAGSAKLPPTALAAGRLMFSADAQYSGIIDWPGLSPNALRMISRQNVAPQMIIGMRCSDVQRYSELSNQSWKPGWRIELMEGKRAPTSTELKEIREAELFLANSAFDLGYDKAVQRDYRHLTSFPAFLESAVRDGLTYAACALWKDTDQQGRVKAFALLPAGNIRHTAMRTTDNTFQLGGYNGDPQIATAMVSDMNEVIGLFTREELTFYIRNPRPDVDIYGYGYPEIEQAIRVIQGFQNALEMNTDTFTRNAVPNGILVLKGGQVTQKQLDLLNRIWTNLKKGVSKSWALPVIGLSEDSEIEVLDLSRMKGNEGYYKEYTNMLAGMLCTLWKFPVSRLGYKASGQGHDTVSLPDAQVNTTDADDPGLAPLLMWLEGLINPYLIWTRWPHLKFTFCGKSPKEDARSYEARRNAMTLKEARAEADQPPLEEVFKDADPKIKFVAQLLDMAPIDPNLAGVFQSIAASLTQAEFATPANEPATPGNRMNSKKDPARSEAHGATSGVRRDSKAETPKT